MTISPQAFRPRLLDTLKGYDRIAFGKDLGAGISVGIVALPLAMAFAIASGVKPEQGLVTAIVAGFLISALGGSNVQIGGPAGAFIVIVYGIVERYGLANLLIATMLAGGLLFAMGWLKLGALVRYIPVSIVIGFTNGIAVLIALSQVRDLLGLQIDKLPADFFSQISTLAAHLHSLNPWSAVLGLSCTAGLFLWPRLFKPDAKAHLPGTVIDSRAGRLAQRIPGPIVALVSLTLVASILRLPVETIGDRFGSIPQTLPPMALPAFSWATAKLLLMPTLTIALLGAIESLLCARVADNLSSLPRHDPNQELMAQGIANIVTPLFGGIPATGTIARTVTNVRAGAVSPVAGMVHAVTLLLVMLLAAPLALHVPLAVLAGVLLFVAWNMGEWREFARLRHFLLPYRTVMLGTFFLTVVFDLTVAVEFGLLGACGFFVWRMSTLFKVEALTTPSDLDLGPADPQSIAGFELFGSLFFGAVGKIEALPERLAAPVRVVVLDLHRLVSMDTSGLDALQHLQHELSRAGRRLILASVNEQPRSLMRRAGFEALVGSEAIQPDLRVAWAAAARIIHTATRDERPEAASAGPAST